MELAVKYLGWSVLGVGFVSRTHEGPTISNLGFLAQLGYFFVPETFEVALRGAGTIFDEAIPNEYEYAAAFNYYVAGHGLKVQTDYSYLVNNGGLLNQDDHRVRTQVQFIF